MHNAVSLYLDTLRLAAALVVFIIHANYLLPGGVPLAWHASSLGGEAVTVFFVLSGLIIAHVVRTRETRAGSYVAARLARLYSVVLPALLVTVVLDVAGAALAPAGYAAPAAQQAWGLAASLLFANELWFMQVRPPSNTPFWSLGYEFWYYMIYAAACYVPGRRRKCAAVAALCLACGPKILLLMPAWLFGVAAYPFIGRRRPRPSAAALLAVATAVGLYLLAASGAKAEWRAATIAVLGAPALALGPASHFLYSCAFGLLATVHIVAMAALAPACAGLWHGCERAVRAASACTFAIYLFHYPLLKFLAAATATAGLGMLRGPAVMAAALAVIAALGPACDRMKPALRRWFRDRIAVLSRAGLQPADVGNRHSSSLEGDQVLRGQARHDA